MTSSAVSGKTLALVIGKVVFCVIAMFEAWLMLGLAYVALRPNYFDFLDEEPDRGPHVLAASLLIAIAVVFGLGIVTAWAPRFPLRKVVLGVAVGTFAVLNGAVWGAAAIP